MTAATYENNIFVNCPFDSEYRPLFEAITFSVYELGYYPRCALEVDDSSQVRIQKINDIIKACRLSAKATFLAGSDNVIARSASSSPRCRRHSRPAHRRGRLRVPAGQLGRITSNRFGRSGCRKPRAGSLGTPASHSIAAHAAPWLPAKDECATFERTPDGKIA